MTVSQKRAIWYKERDKRNASIDAFLQDYNLQSEFHNSNYKTRTGYMKHIMRQMEPERKYAYINDRYIHAYMAMNGKYRNKTE